jgi:hypothetical protein
MLTCHRHHSQYHLISGEHALLLLSRATIADTQRRTTQRELELDDDIALADAAAEHEMLQLDSALQQQRRAFDDQVGTATLLSIITCLFRCLCLCLQTLTRTSIPAFLTPPYLTRSRGARPKRKTRAPPSDKRTN